MKKGIYIILLALLSSTVSIKAQQSKTYQLLFSLEKIESIINITQEQRGLIKTAISQRTDTIVNQTQKEKNSIYCRSLYQLLNTSQLNKLIGGIIDKEKVEQDALSFFNEKMASKGYPSDYVETIKEDLRKFERKMAYLELRYISDKTLKSQFKNEVLNKRKEWYVNIRTALSNALQTWGKLSTKCNSLNQELKNDFIDYHFYVSLKNLQEPILSEISNKTKSLSEKESTNVLIKQIAACKVNNRISDSEKLQNKDSLLIKFLEKKLDSTLQNEMLNKTASLKPYYTVVVKTADVKGFMKQFKENETTESNDAENENSLEVLANKARKAGLDDARVSSFLALIIQRDKDTEAFKAAKKNRNNPDIVDVGSQKNLKEIKKEFAKNLAAILSKKEYVEILGDNFKPIAVKKAKEEIKQVQATYNLTKEQYLAVYKKMSIYYFNKTVTESYYSFDKKVLKQKLSGLRYYFEKGYKQLMDSFNIEVKQTKIDSRTFQY